MLFLNKETELKWKITDKEHIKILLKDEKYEVIEKENMKVDDTKVGNVNVDYKTLSYKKLQELAKEKGLEKVQIKKNELIQYLKEGE